MIIRLSFFISGCILGCKQYKHLIINIICGAGGSQQAIRVNASKKVLWGWVEYTTAYYWKYTPNGPVQFGKEVKSGHDIMILGNPFPNGAKLYMWTRGTGEENCGIMTVQL